MGRVVYVSMLDNDWTTSTASFTQRVVDLQRLCAVPVAPTATDNNPLHVVLAPEYTFRRNPAEVVRKGSETYHGATRTPQGAFDAFRKSRETSTVWSRNDKDLLLFHMCAITRDKNVAVIPGTIFWEEQAPVFRRTTILRTRQVVQKGVARNSCFVVHQGGLVLAYHKQVPSHELDTFERDSYDFRAGVMPGTFNLSGLSVGLEICADHASSSNLRTGLIAANNANMTPEQRFVHNRLSTPGPDGSQTEFGLDLQLVVSDGMDISRQTLAIRKGGFVAHCDTRLPKSVQERTDSGALRAVPSTAHNSWMFEYALSSTFRTIRDRWERGSMFPS